MAEEEEDQAPEAGSSSGWSAGAGEVSTLDQLVDSLARRAAAVVEEGGAAPEGSPGEAAQGEGQGEGAAGVRGSAAGSCSGEEVLGEVFEELHLAGPVAEEVQDTWGAFLRSAESREAAGEAIYAAIFDSAPGLQGLFKTPRAVMSMRFMGGLSQIISQLHSPQALKVVVETLGFQHLDLEVTAPRVAMFRDAIRDLLQVELGEQLTRIAHEGWDTMLNYVGGAYIYVRMKYTDRIKILASSWATANNKMQELAGAAEGAEGANVEAEQGGEAGSGASEVAHSTTEGKGKHAKRKRKIASWFSGAKAEAGLEALEHGMEKGSANSDGGSFKNTSVPTTYNEMFMFNAAVMGFGQNLWMKEILASFDTVVTNVSNSYRLQEECDVLSLRIAKYRGAVNLSEYKAVMLASLRSLVPRDWDSNHEVAWSWLWENVERMLQALTGRPARMEACLERLWSGLDENAQALVRREVYTKFFALAPAGQDFFKQSTTRLHFIADRIVSMTLEIYKDPSKMVEDISALGLRHVGYGIPTELFGPFVTACVQVVRGLTDDDGAEEAFRWSLSLISRILTRVITEGSTIVMKAINLNSGPQIRKAVGCAARGQRAAWMLRVQVGTQAISPLLWAIERGSLEAARAILRDLLTIRADRDRYYYGMDALFERHEDIVRRLCVDAPALLPCLLDGLVWRSRTTEDGTRRVIYYVRHLLVNSSGQFAQALEWITDNGDPKLITHPILTMVTDIVWFRVARRTFLMNKVLVLLTACVFIAGTGRLTHGGMVANNEAERIFVGSCRCVIYLVNLGYWLYYHVRRMCRDVRGGKFISIGGVPVPEYLDNYEEWASLFLTVLLLAMLAFEPILYCFPHKDGDFDGAGLFTEECPQGGTHRSVHAKLSAAATITYFSLIVDISALSTRVSSFVLVCYQVSSDVFLSLFGLSFVVLAWSCAANALEQDGGDFSGIPTAARTFIKIALGMYEGGAFRSLREEPLLMATVVAYMVVSAVLLLNLLTAQLNCSYQAKYRDMIGYARLNRGKIVVEAMQVITEARWRAFVDSLRLDEPCEFGQGDIGLAGGIQVREPANANITTVDIIRRFGGSTSVLAQWPEDELQANADEDRFERIEKMIAKNLKRAGSRGDVKKVKVLHSSGGGSGTVSSGAGSSGAGADQASLAGGPSVHGAHLSEGRSGSELVEKPLLGGSG